jgi:hypothetical protein
MDESRIIVGAPYNNVRGTEAGAAFVYYWTGSTWYKQAKLTSADQAAYDRCGTSVSIDGNYAVVGCPTDDLSGAANAGSAYVWYWNGSSWAMQDHLQAGDYGASDQFGKSVAISGDRIVVGAPYWDSATDQGSVYVFQRNGTAWDQWPDTSKKFTASDGAASDLFGTAVDIEGDYIIAGAPANDAAYIFHYEWDSGEGRYSFVQTKLIDGGSYTAAGSYFGYSVGIAGTTYTYAVVGSPYEDYDGVPPDNWPMMGAAYVFYRLKSGDPWGEVEYLLGAAESYSQFGYSVAIDKTNSYRWIAVGAPYRDAGGRSNAGEARVFQGNAGPYWSLVATVTGSDAEASQYTGSSVTIARANAYAEAVVGSPYNDVLIGATTYTDMGSAEICDGF